MVGAMLIIGGLVAIATGNLRLTHFFHVTLTGKGAQEGGFMLLALGVFVLARWWKRLEYRDRLREMMHENRQSMRYYKRRWADGIGGKGADWGSSDLYFEAALDGTVTRQAVVYDDRTVLLYDADRTEDSFGALSEQPIEHDEYLRYLISSQDFESVWAAKSRFQCQ